MSRKCVIIAGIAVLLLFPIFLHSDIIIDDEGRVVVADEAPVEEDDWASFYDDEKPEEEIKGPYVDQLAIKIDVVYPASYDPLNEAPEIIIKTISPFFTNCFFYIKIPDQNSYDILSSSEDQSLRREEMSGKRKIYHQQFNVTIPKYYLGGDISFYITATSLIGREASFGSPKSPILIKVEESEKWISTGVQVVFFFTVVLLGALFIKKVTGPKKEEKKAPARRRMPRRPAVKRDEEYTERDRLL